MGKPIKQILAIWQAIKAMVELADLISVDDDKHLFNKQLINYTQTICLLKNF